MVTDSAMTPMIAPATRSSGQCAPFNTRVKPSPAAATSGHGRDSGKMRITARAAATLPATCPEGKDCSGLRPEPPGSAV